jgi:phasin family protein
MAADPKWPPGWNPADWKMPDWKMPDWGGGAMPGAEEFKKLLDGLKMPHAPDADALMRAYQRNIEALSAANRIALEGAQAVAKRHMEIMQQTMAELTETMKALAGNEGPQEKAAKQAELLKAAYEKAVTNTRELGDLIQRANGEALGALNQRVSEAIDEMKALIKPTKG